MSANKKFSSAGRIIGNIAMILVWAAMAVVLLAAGLTVCTVKLLKPEQLTHFVTKIANDNLNADVNVGLIRMSFAPAFPHLELRIDSFTVISHTFDTIPTDQRAMLPVYADSLLTVDCLRAGIDLSKLIIHKEIHINEVEITRPGVNIVLASGGQANFDIYSSEPDTTKSDTALAIPAITLRRFSMFEPREIRYFNALDSTSMAVQLQRVALDGEEAPSYTITVDGKINSPIVRQLVKLSDISIGVGGGLRWDPSTPSIITADDFTLRGEFVRAHVDCLVDLGSTLAVDSARLVVEPVRIDSVLNVIPDEILRNYGITPGAIHTDMAVGLSAHLLRPFVPERDTVPNAQANLTIDNCYLNHGPMRLHDISLDMTVNVNGTNYNDIVVNLARFTAADPATSIEASGRLSNILSDPTFDCNVAGNILLSNLPVPIRRAIDGAIDGHVSLDLEAAGRSSMFKMGHLHNLDVRGRAQAFNLYYMKADTDKYVSAHHVDIRFGSQTQSHRNARERPNSMTALVRIDTASAIVSGVTMKLGNLALGLGVENSGSTIDSTRVLPMGGALRVGSFSVTSVTDSAGMRLKGLRGRVNLRRHEGDGEVPEIRLNAGIDRLSAGAPQARVFINDASLKALTYLRPDRQKARKEIRQISDSISRIYPALPPDSVYAHAVAIRMARRRHHQRRTRMVEVNDAEVLDWGISKGFRRYLNDWHLAGELSTTRARLRTPYFPIRNRLEHIQLAFSNDSIVIDSLRYRGGRSDLAINGIVSNIRRSLAGRGASPLKLNFEIFSDTLDINQFAAATFAGAEHAEKVRRGTAHNVAFDDSDTDSGYEIALKRDSVVAPILIPANIDANLGIRADNIFYSDLKLHDFSGDLLVYDGAVNLSNLRAFSDMGNVNISALYSAPRRSDIKAGMALKLDDFNIERFLTLVPAIDSIMPLMRDFSGMVSANIAATVDIDSTMNLVLPSLDAAVYLSGRDLAFINADTYRTIGKWLRFRDRADNHIRSMEVQLLVRDNEMHIFPFKFDIDRYTLGVVGYNDLAMNFNYHIAVLKSPLPFKFGVTVKGDPEHYKIRLGGANFNMNEAATNVAMVDNVRINLIDQIRGVFRRGVSHSDFATLNAASLGSAQRGIVQTDTLSRADSLLLEQSVLPPDSISPVQATPPSTKKRRKK